MVKTRTVFSTVYLIVTVLVRTGLSSEAVEEFYKALYDEVAVETENGQILPEDAVENYLPTLEQQYEAAVHMLAKTPEHLIEHSNFLIDVANTLNVATFDDMDFSAYPALDKAIKISEENLCSPLSCDLTSQWRSVDGTCNNLDNPRWGAAKEAQNRIIPAEWEEGALLPFTLAPGMAPIDATRNGVKVADDDHVIFIAVGNIPLILRFEGDDEMVITLQPDFANDASVIQVNGLTVGEIIERLYGKKKKTYLWVRWAETDGQFRITLGTDSECEEDTALLSIPHAPVRFDRLYLEAGESLSGGKQYVKASFYIRTNYEVETSDGNDISLENVPWIYQNHKSFVFGVQRQTGSFTILITGNDESTFESSAELNIGLEDGLSSGLRICIRGTCDDYTIQHDNIFSTGAGFDYFWVSWMGRSVHFGAGIIAGKNAFDFYAATPSRRLFDETFTVTDVHLKSTEVVRWLFNIKQINVPRKTSRCGRPLPSPRSVSLAVHCRTGPTKLSHRLTLMTFQVGQHVDHDIIGTPLQTYNGMPITCAENNIPYPPDKLNRFCFNIIVSNFMNAEGDQGSHPQSKVRALNFVRSGVMIDCDDSLLPRDLRVRNPINILTSFLDGSNLYTNSDEDLNEIRAIAPGDTDKHTSQYMQLDERNELPPTATISLETPCNNNADPEKLCRKSGDFRSNEHSGLNSIHTIWAREHNRIATELTTVYSFPETTAEERELIFQHTRKIVIAEMQDTVNVLFNRHGHIGTISYMYLTTLSLGKPRHFQIVYNGYLKSYMDPAIGDLFGLGIGAPEKKCSYNSNLDPTIFNCFGLVYRIGHSMITETLRGADPANGFEEIKLKDNFFTPLTSYEDGGTESILKYFAHAACPGTDSCFCDVDPFTAAVSEMALIDRPDYTSTSLIGELTNYVMADTFGRLRCGDRFWYEFDAAGFTDAQKAELSKATFARVLCDNVNSITEIQRDVFLIPNLTDENGVNINEVVDCSQIPVVNLSFFTIPFSLE